MGRRQIPETEVGHFLDATRGLLAKLLSIITDINVSTEKDQQAARFQTV